MRASRSPSEQLLTPLPFRSARGAASHASALIACPRSGAVVALAVSLPSPSLRAAASLLIVALWGFCPGIRLHGIALLPLCCARSAQDILAAAPVIVDSWRRGMFSEETCAQESGHVVEHAPMRLLTYREYFSGQRGPSAHLELADGSPTAGQAHRLPFRGHPLIREWLAQYQGDGLRQCRWKSLLLRGKACSGKTQKACSIFGLRRSCVIKCQGLGTQLPALTRLDRSKHAALILDGVNYRQVLENKLMFQADGWVAQSAHSPGMCPRSVSVHKLPIILCSDDFPMTVAEGIAPEEADWLAANLIDVPAPVSAEWWFCGAEDALECASSLSGAST